MKRTFDELITSFRAERVKTGGITPFAAKVRAADDDAGEKVGELYIYDVIGEGWFGGISPQTVVDALGQMKKDGCNALEVFINSPGGDVFDGIAIYNVIKRFDGSKEVYVDGLAASAASLIAMAGDEIITAPNAMWMIHEPWGVAIGNAVELRKTADTMDQVAGVLLDTYAAQCGTKASKKDIKQWMAEETWMTAQEALDRGFTDSIGSDVDATADEEKVAAAVKEDPTRQSAALVATMKRRLDALRVNPKSGLGQPARKK